MTSRQSVSWPQRVHHFLTLEALASLWRDTLSGMRIRESYSISREQWVTHLENPDGYETVLVAVFHPKLSFIYRPDRFVKPQKGWLPQMEFLNGAEVQSVRHPAYDRSLYLDLGSFGALLFKLHGGMGNVLAFDAMGSMRAAFSYRYARDQSRRLPDYSLDARTCLQSMSGSLEAGLSMASALQNALPGLDHSLLPPDIDRYERPQSAWEAAQEFWVKSAMPPYGLAIRNPPQVQDPGVYLLLNPDLEKASAVPEYGHLEDALAHFARQFFQRKAQASWYERLGKHLRKERQRLEKQLRSAERSLEQSAQKRNYQRMGDLLMAYMHQIPRGAQEAQLPDFDTGKLQHIPLKPQWTLPENAERYYRKAKNQPLETDQAEKKMIEAMEGLEKLEQEENRLEAAWERGLDALRQLGRSYRLDSNMETASALPIRQYGLDGFEIWVGKHARGNEYLLSRARKEDLWMHARGYAGSHLIVRQDKNRPAPETVKERAASIAAFYSKGKHAGLCPVICTLRKYVRKPKGSPPGAVRVEREEVLLVHPHIPEDAVSI